MFKVCVASQVQVDLEISAVPVDPGQAASKEDIVLMPCCTFHCLLSGSYVYITKVVKLRSVNITGKSGKSNKSGRFQRNAMVPPWVFVGINEM